MAELALGCCALAATGWLVGCVRQVATYPADQSGSSFGEQISQEKNIFVGGLLRLFENIAVLMRGPGELLRYSHSSYHLQRNYHLGQCGK